MSGYFVATDFTKHTSHAFVEVFDWQDFERAAFLKKMLDAVSDVVEERAICPTTSGGGPVEGFLNPISLVADNLLAADLKSGEIFCETNHGDYLKSLRCMAS